MRTNIYILAVLIMAPIMCFTQDWEPMDAGFAFEGGNGVSSIYYHTNNNTLYVGGEILVDQIGNWISGFAKWNNQINVWEIVIPAEPLGQPRHLFSYNDELYAGYSAGLKTIQNDQSFLITNGPNSLTRSSSVINDNLYLVGDFNFVGEDHTYGIAIYDGEEFTSVDIETNTPNGPRLDDIIEHNNEIFIVGKNMSGYPFYEWYGLAQLVDDDIEVVHEEFTGTFFSMHVFALESYQDNLYVGGTFNTSLGFTGNGLQSFDGENMFDVGGGVNGHVLDMKVYEGELYVVGRFTRIGEGVMFNSNEGGEPCEGVAKWNGESWTCLNYGDPNTGRFIETLEIYNDTLYIGGSFTELSGDTTLSMIARKRIYPDSTLVSIDDESTLMFSVYPNPSNGKINIDFGQPINDACVIRMFNSIGQLVIERNIALGFKEFKFTSDFPQGLYSIQIQLGMSISNKKIVLLD